MDREIRILKKGRPFADYNFNYKTATSGQVKITIYSIIDYNDGEGGFSAYKMYELDERFDHGALKSIDEIKRFDRDFVKKYDHFERSDPSLEFIYDAVEYRYVVSDHKLMGMINVSADLNANKRELKFMSVREIKEDFAIEGTSVDSNVMLFKNFVEQYFYETYPQEFQRINYSAR